MLSRARGAKLRALPARPADPDDGHLEATAPGQRLQRRKNLLVGQIAGGAEEHEGVRRGGCHFHLFGTCAGFSAWPPNSRRIADSTRLAKSASPRELKRSEERRV